MVGYSLLNLLGALSFVMVTIVEVASEASLQVETFSTWRTLGIQGYKGCFGWISQAYERLPSWWVHLHPEAEQMVIGGRERVLPNVGLLASFYKCIQWEFIKFSQCMYDNTSVNANLPSTFPILELTPIYDNHSIYINEEMKILKSIVIKLKNYQSYTK